MQRFIIRRLIYMVVTMIAATLLVFTLSRIVGDPRLLYVQEGGYGLSQEAWDDLGRKLHLQYPVIVQYGFWLADALRADLGESMLDRKPVAEIIWEAFPNTLQMALGGWIVATVLGVPLGVLSAVKRGSIWDYIGRTVALTGQTLPVFWIGIMGILIFSVQLGWLPVGTKPDHFSIKHFILPLHYAGVVPGCRLSSPDSLGHAGCNGLRVYKAGTGQGGQLNDGAVETRLPQRHPSATDLLIPHFGRVHYRSHRHGDCVLLARLGPPGIHSGWTTTISP